MALEAKRDSLGVHKLVAYLISVYCSRIDPPKLKEIVMPVVDLSTLPANAQQEILDFYEFLQEKYSNRKANVMATTLSQQPIKEDFKTFIMNIPKIEGIEFERQRDYPSTQLR